MQNDAADFELQKEPAPPRPPAPPPRSSPTLWIVAALVLVLGAGAAFFYLRREPAAGPASDSKVATEASVEPSRPLGVEVPPTDLPPLDDSDAFVRQLVRALSSHPLVAAWLTTDGLIRNFVIVVDNIAAGQTPAGRLRVLKPAGSFKVVEVKGTTLIDVRGYSRYNDLAGAAGSINAAGAAKLYSTLKPRIEEAYRELGRDGSFDARLETAIVRLLEAPQAGGELVLVPRGGVWAYGDGRIEQLTGAQKQLVRMGPVNVRTIQRSLRDIALALGIPPGRLPRRP